MIDVIAVVIDECVPPTGRSPRTSQRHRQLLLLSLLTSRSFNIRPEDAALTVNVFTVGSPMRHTKRRESPIPERFPPLPRAEYQRALMLTGMLSLPSVSVKTWYTTDEADVVSLCSSSTDPLV